MQRNWMIIALTGVILFVVICLSIQDFYSTERRAFLDYQEHQILHAQHLANQIESLFWGSARGLQALSPFISLQYANTEQGWADIQARSKELVKSYVKEILLYNEIGRIIYSTNVEAIGSDYGHMEFFVWAKKRENRGKVFVSLVPPAEEEKKSEPYQIQRQNNMERPESQPLGFFLAVPLYQDSPNEVKSGRNGKFIGAFSLKIDLKEFLLHELKSSKLNFHQIWIVNNSGKLLFHSEHPEMVLRNIHKKEASCTQCHISFDHVETILKKKRGTTTYKVGNFSNKIASFAPVTFENASWVVVVDSPYGEVMAFARKSLREHLMLLAIIVLAFIAGSTLIIRNDRLKVRAEVEAEYWREKITERRKAEEALQLEHNKLKSILDSMGDGVYIVNQQYEIQYINPVIEREFGPVKERKCHEYFHDLPEVCSWCRNQEVFSGKSVEWEWYSFKTGKTYDLFDTPILNENGTISKLEIFHDITQRKRAEKELQKSEEQFRMLVETINEGLGIQDENGLWTYVNDKLCHMLGYFQGELIGRPVLEFLDEANQSIVKDHMAGRRKGESKSYEIAWSRRDGQKLSAIVSPRPIFGRHGQFKGSFAIITDITERKIAEDALRESEKQLRYLSSQLLTIQEQERKRISAELHDELGQALALMKLRLNLIEKALRQDQGATREECKNTLQYIDQVIENVRRLSRDLSPSILEDLGFSAALRWLINNFSKSYDIKISLDMEDIDHVFSQKTHIFLYRIFQEALTNIGKHAQATRVSIAIKEESDAIFFLVEDDGKGFDVKQATMRKVTEKGLGLATMNERVWMLGGSLDLWSQEGKGTRIAFRIPLGKEGRPQ